MATYNSATLHKAPLELAEVHQRGLPGRARPSPFCLRIVLINLSFQLRTRPCADIRQNKKGEAVASASHATSCASLNQMRDLGEYLRAYVAYVSANLGWGKALRFVLVWLAGMFLPLGARTLVQLPEWVPMTWMIGWALLGYIFAPYGMWKHHRAQIASSIQPNQKEPR